MLQDGPSQLSEVARRGVRKLLAGKVGEGISGAETLLERITVHEASHGVVSLLNGEHPFRIVVTRSGGFLQMTAEDPAIGDSANDDESIENIQSILRRADEAELDLHEISEEARGMLVAHWRAVQAVAASLRQRLIGAERAVLGGGELRLLFQFNS